MSITQTISDAAANGIDNLKDAFKGGLKNPNVVALAGQAANMLADLFPEKSEYSGENGGVTKGIDTAYDGLMNAAGFIPGIGGFISAGMAGNKLLGNAFNTLGAGTDGMTTGDSILGSSLFASNLGAINGLFGKRSVNIDNSLAAKDAMAGVGSDYSGSIAGYNAASKRANKKYGLISGGARRKANRQINEANRQMDQMKAINIDAQERANLASNMSDFNSQRYMNQINGGYDARTYLGRQGIKLDIIKKAKKIAHKVRDKEVESKRTGGVLDIDKFQKGGSFNIIPDGALHARLHHMADTEELTQKGIPVVDKDGNQQAEIERDEIIFRKEVTDKIEAYAKDGSEEAALECGKLLVKEILENTQDNSKLMSKFKEGGILKAQMGSALAQAIDWSKWTPIKLTPVEQTPAEQTRKLIDGALNPSAPIPVSSSTTPSTPNIPDNSSIERQAQQGLATSYFEEPTDNQNPTDQEDDDQKQQTLKQVGKAVIEGAKAVGNGIKAGKEQKQKNEQLNQQQIDSFYRSLNGGNARARQFSNLLGTTPTSLQKGGEIPDDEKYEIYRNSLPSNLANTDPKEYRLRRFWELNGKPPVFNPYDKIYEWNPEDKGYHIGSVAYNEDTGEYEFLKTPNHPTIYKEQEWYNSPDGRNFKADWKLITTDENGNPLQYYKYVRREKK